MSVLLRPRLVRPVSGTGQTGPSQSTRGWLLLLQSVLFSLFFFFYIYIILRL